MSSDRLVTSVVRMSRDGVEPKTYIIKQIEDLAKSRGWVLNSDEQGMNRLQPLKQMLGLRVFGPDYLLAVYDRSGQYTHGKIMVPPGYLEDKIQGKVSLVLGIGPLCKGEEYLDWFDNEPPQVGDWVTTSIRDGLTYVMGNMIIKTIEWRYIRMITREPDMVQ